MTVKWEDFGDIELTGVDSRDYPDFCDAYVESAWHIKEDREATEEELDALSDDGLEVNAKAHEEFCGA